MTRAPRFPVPGADKPTRKRPPRRARPNWLPPTATPLDAVIVALDSARTTGYATYVRGQLAAFGEVDARDSLARRAVLRQATDRAYRLGIPVAVMIEIPYGGYRRTMVSLAGTAELWRDTWRELGQASERCIERTAGDWRRVLFGSGALGREHVRRLEHTLAERVVLVDMRPVSPVTVGGDAAAAICIGQTLIRARELARVLGCGCVPRRRDMGPKPLSR